MCITLGAVPEFGSSSAMTHESRVWPSGLDPPFGRLLWAARSAAACPGCPWGGAAWHGDCALLPRWWSAPAAPSCRGSRFDSSCRVPAAGGYAPPAAGFRPRAEDPRRQPAATVAAADAATPPPTPPPPTPTPPTSTPSPPLPSPSPPPPAVEAATAADAADAAAAPTTLAVATAAAAAAAAATAPSPSPPPLSPQQPPTPTPCPVPRTPYPVPRTPCPCRRCRCRCRRRDAAAAAVEEADDAERPPPMLPLMPRGMDADAATPMP